MAAAAALIPGRPGEIADQNHVRPFRQRQRAGIFQQHRALFRRPACRLIIVSAVKRHPVPAALQIFLHQLQHIQNGFVQLLHGQGPRMHCIDYLADALVAAAGHLQVQPGSHAHGSVLHGAPVSHHQAPVAPAGAQDIRQQLLVFTAVGAVDLVICAHHRPGLCLLDHRLESCQIDFVQGALVYAAVAHHAVRLLVIGGKVLDAAARSLGLQAVHQRRAHLPGQGGVLAVILKIAPAQGAALDVQPRAQQHGQVFPLAFPAQDVSQSLGQGRVEAGRYGRRGGKTNRLDAVVDTQMVGVARLLAQAAGAVADHGGRDAQALDGFGVPEIAAGAQRSFFLQRQLAQQFLRIHTGFVSFLNGLRPGRARPGFT